MFGNNLSKELVSYAGVEYDNSMEVPEFKIEGSNTDSIYMAIKKKLKDDGSEGISSYSAIWIAIKWIDTLQRTTIRDPNKVKEWNEYESALGELLRKGVR